MLSTRAQIDLCRRQYRLAANRGRRGNIFVDGAVAGLDGIVGRDNPESLARGELHVRHRGAADLAGNLQPEPIVEKLMLPRSSLAVAAGVAIDVAAALDGIAAGQEYRRLTGRRNWRWWRRY